MSKSRDFPTLDTLLPSVAMISADLAFSERQNVSELIGRKQEAIKTT